MLESSNGGCTVKRAATAALLLIALALGLTAALVLSDVLSVLRRFH